MRKTIKLTILLSLIIVIISINPFNINYAASNTNTLTQEQKALRTVAQAFYNKGSLVQYCSYRRTFLSTPEDATSQNVIYSVCSDFTYTVYKNALGAEIPFSTNQITAYGKKYYNSKNIKTNDLIEFWEQKSGKFIDNKGNNKSDINLSNADGKKKYEKDLLEKYKLQVGDLICYTAYGGEGHVVMIYDVKYKDNKPTSATIIEVSSHYNTTDNKIKKGLSYRKTKNNSTGIVEGAVRQRSLSDLINNVNKYHYFTVYRPLLKDSKGELTGKYYKASFKNVDNPSDNVKVECTGRAQESYKITQATSSRLKYPGISIYKTVDKYNGSNVSLNSTLKYTIKIANKSTSTTYKNLAVTENISKYVTVSDKGGGDLTGNTLKWNVSSIGPGTVYELKYTVKVNNEKENLGKAIKSTGKIANIETATVTNKISKSLKADYKTKIKNKTKELFNSKKYHGKELIENIYKEALGSEIKIKDLKIDDLILTRGGTDYYPESSRARIRLNPNNEFKQMILRNYYGALYTNKANSVYLKMWEDKDFDKRDSRADTIYNGNFQTGDILVFKNKQTPGEGQKFPKEDGTYYYIYLSESDKIKVGSKEVYGFIGLNNSKNLKTVSTDYLELQNLLAKDYFVILRPAQTIEFNVGETPPDPPTSPSGSPSESPLPSEPSSSASPSESTAPSTTSSPSSTSKPSSTPSASVSTSPSSSSGTSPSPSTSATSTPSTSPTPSETTWPTNPSRSYTFKVNSEIAMSQILIYRKATNNKYVLFYKVPLEGQKEYEITLRKSQLTKIGDSPLKLVIVGENGERNIQNITIPQ